MDPRKAQCGTPACTKKIMTTAGVLLGLGVISTATVGVLKLRSDAIDACQQASSSLALAISSFLNYTFSLENFSVNFTTNIPTQVPASANISTPFGIYPIHTNVSLDLPEALTATLAPIVEQVKSIIGQSAVTTLNAFPQQAYGDCNTVLYDLIIAAGIAFALYLVWQVATTFAFGSKLIEHGERLATQDKRIDNMEKAMAEWKSNPELTSVVVDSPRANLTSS